MSPSVSEISIVTVNWNGLAHLQDLLPSLHHLGAREIVVVDNGSSDGSVEWLQGVQPQIRLIENSINEGFAQPCNQGAQQSTGKYVAFINNDMRADRHWLEAALPFLDAETPCVASRILNWDGTRIDFNGSSLQYLGYALQRDIGALVEEVSAQETVLFPCGGAMLTKRDRFLELGGFDPDYFAIFEDVDLGWRIWLAGQKVAFAPESVVYHRGHATFSAHPDQKMRYLMHRNALLTVLKNYDQENFRKILPIALSLAITRAIRLSGVRKESYYLWSDSRERLERKDTEAFDRMLDGLNHLVAVEDVLASLPRLMEKRQKVQSMRRRSDEEIFGLFVEPFRPIVEDPEYIAQETEWLDWMQWLPRKGVRQNFDREDLPDRLRERIERLRAELLAQQWLAGRALVNPPPSTSTAGLRAFLRSWRREGLRAAWKRFVERVESGI